MAQLVQGFKLLFDRPNEPLISPKGDSNTLFQLTPQHLGALRTEDYKINNDIIFSNRAGASGDEIQLEEIKQLPNFTIAKQLPYDAEFSTFLPWHQECADEVIDILLSVEENQLHELLSICAFARINLNSQLFNYCYSVALMHRNDTRNVPIQNFAQTFPSKFVNSQVFGQARESATVAAQGGPRVPIIIPRDFTATDLDIEHRVAYFREDIGVNLHHWHWHLIYPFSAKQRRIVEKDRRGELFFYMHEQIIARYPKFNQIAGFMFDGVTHYHTRTPLYNGERLNNALARVKQFNNWDEPIREGYYPKLDSLTTSRGWPPRQANMRWQDLNRPADRINITIAEMKRWRRNVEDTIATGIVRKADGTTQPLDIDILGNMVEASILSPNPQLYGSLHNNGHSFTAYMHDPTHRYLENFGVMADEATTMRDPFFYRWHAFIDDLFQKFKESTHVSPYTPSQLGNPGVQITSVRIESSTGDVNTLNTFWMQSDVDMSRGLDFSNRGPVYVRFTHLNHRPFQYVIEVNNTGNARRTTVRIFIAPKFDERRRSWTLADQRKMFIEMDKFAIPLNAGRNTIVRQSTQSSVTIPFEQTFRDLSQQGSDATAFNYCGCGWPQHMLVPRGTEPGAAYDLFVMLSNYDLDSVNNPEGSTAGCVEAYSFCGLKDKLYPDRRSMGFPFDRPSITASTIDDFILPNMFRQDITIRLQDVTEINPKNPTS